MYITREEGCLFPSPGPTVCLTTKRQEGLTSGARLGVLCEVHSFDRAQVRKSRGLVQLILDMALDADPLWIYTRAQAINHALVWIGWRTL